MAKQKSPRSLGDLVGQAAETLPSQEPDAQPRATQRGYRYPMEEEDLRQRPRQKVGRKPSFRTIQRRSGMSIFFENAHRAALSRIGEFDKQDVVRTALDEFIRQHCQNGFIDDTGRELVADYVYRTTDHEAERNAQRILRDPAQPGW